MSPPAKASDYVLERVVTNDSSLFSAFHASNVVKANVGLSDCYSSYPTAAMDYALATVGVRNRYYVEFGFPEKMVVREVMYNCSSSNTFSLRQRGWKGLLLDLNMHYRPMNLALASITSQSVVRVFRRNSVPREPDFISIDIDSHDVWVLDAMLKVYRPRIVQIEYNPNFGMTEEHAIAFPDTYAGMQVRNGATDFTHGRCYMSSSAAAYMVVAARHGYVLTDSIFQLKEIAQYDLYLARADLWPMGRVITLQQLWERHKAAGCIHAPMLKSQATNLVDLAVIMRGGDVCTARRCAARALRRMARVNASADFCHTCFIKLVDLERVSGWNCNCTDAHGLPIALDCPKHALEAGMGSVGTPASSHIPPVAHHRRPT
jgi:hypothetical protein